MPRDEWKRAADRAKYGPVHYEKKAKKERRKSAPKADTKKPRTVEVFILHIRTPISVIKPNGSEIQMETTKTLKFFKQAKLHLREGFHTFERRGFYLIVESKYVGRDTIRVRN